jgi:hypothetical protein
MALCIGQASGSRFDLCIHDDVLELSVMFRQQGCGDESSGNCIMLFIASAKYSFRLSVNDTCSFSVSSYLQAMPVMNEYPAMPRSHESDKFIDVGTLKITLFIDIPLCALRMSFSQRVRSCFASLVTMAVLYFSALAEILRSRFMK